MFSHSINFFLFSFLSFPTDHIQDKDHQKDNHLIREANAKPIPTQVKTAA